MRKCKKCEIEKPDSDFEVINKEKGWMRGECKACTRKRVKDWASHSKEHIRQKRREHYAANKYDIVRRATEWQRDNPERRKANALAYYYRLQDAAIEAYGGYRCSWCGINEPMVLTIDHINNDGAQHRKEIGNTGAALYKWLRDNDYPPEFQVLCMNCNHGKHRNGGELLESLRGRCNDYLERE